jgi:hypothetical protein
MNSLLVRQVKSSQVKSIQSKSTFISITTNIKKMESVNRYATETQERERMEWNAPLASNMPHSYNPPYISNMACSTMEAALLSISFVVTHTTMQA